MKKKLAVTLVTLTILVGVAGTLSYARYSQLQAKEEITEIKKEKVVVAKAKVTDTAPIIEGQKDWEVTQGEAIDVLTGVTAKDDSEKKVKLIASKFSTEKVGDQAVTISAEDDAHNKTTTTITVHVKAVPKPQSEPQKAVEPEAVATDSQPWAEAPIAEEAPESQPTPIAVAEAPVEVAQPVAQPAPTWAANTMYVGGIEISYQNAGQGSGQAVIDTNSNVIATWGGNAVQSGTDGGNTHFIGHNPGIFSVLFSLGGGSQIIVTDGNGTPTYYTVNQIFQVDDYATGVADGQSYVDQIIGSGGGERITLQTCVNDDINLIVMASAA